MKKMSDITKAISIITLTAMLVLALPGRAAEADSTGNTTAGSETRELMDANNFDSQDDVQNYTQGIGLGDSVKPTVENGAIKATAQETKCGVFFSLGTGSSSRTIRTDACRQVRIRLKSNQDISAVQLMYASAEWGNIDAGAYIRHETVISASKDWQTVALDMSKAKGWTGTMQRFTIQLEYNSTGAAFEIDSIEFYSGVVIYEWNAKNVTLANTVNNPGEYAERDIVFEDGSSWGLSYLKDVDWVDTQFKYDSTDKIMSVKYPVADCPQEQLGYTDFPHAFFHPAKRIKTSEVSQIIIKAKYIPKADEKNLMVMNMCGLNYDSLTNVSVSETEAAVSATDTPASETEAPAAATEEPTASAPPTPTPVPTPSPEQEAQWAAALSNDHSVYFGMQAGTREYIIDVSSDTLWHGIEEITDFRFVDDTKNDQSFREYEIEFESIKFVGNDYVYYSQTTGKAPFPESGIKAIHKRYEAWKNAPTADLYTAIVDYNTYDVNCDENRGLKWVFKNEENKECHWGIYSSWSTTITSGNVLYGFILYKDDELPSGKTPKLDAIRDNGVWLYEVPPLSPAAE